VLGVEHGWSTRRERIAELGEHTTCKLIELNRSGSGPGTPSLAVVRAAEPPELLINRRDPQELKDWQQRADRIAAQPSLFDDPGQKRRPYEVVPWKFQYSYRCLAVGCNGHKPTIIDWEAATLWRKIRDRHNWKELMREKFVNELWDPGRDTVLFVGNMHRHPQNFLALGVFWPPRGGMQKSLPT
jgi:hypothetical protein